MALNYGKVYESAEILAADDLYTLQESFTSCGVPFLYRLTTGEREWLRFVSGRYAIADWCGQNMDGDILTFDDAQELGEALHEDGTFPKAAMLADNTALQKLFFWLAYHPDE